MSILPLSGHPDLLPPETELWNHIETTVRRIFERYAFGEIRTPVFEDTQLFARGVGEETDIVSKEMYTFTPAADPPRQGRSQSEPPIADPAAGKHGWCRSCLYRAQNG